MDWIELSNLSDLDTLNSESRNETILIFKHSTRCPLSDLALNRLETKWTLNLKTKTYYLDLIANRNISDEIATRYDVAHESPQVLLIKDEECIYNSSHSRITFDTVSDYLK